MIMEEAEEIILPNLSDRVKAIIADSVLQIIAMALFAYGFGHFESVPDSARIIASVLIVLVYDPFLTAFTGGTIGHKLAGIEVKQISNRDKNLKLIPAVLRFLLKVCLGWVSLITVSTSENRQALHDFAVSSIVLYKK